MIKGLTPTLAEGGKIKIGKLGEARKSDRGNEYRLPTKLDHFIITKTTRDASGDFEIDDPIMEALDKDEDGCIREIPIVLHTDEIDEVFPTAYALYKSRKLLCRGDGERAVKAGGDACTCPCPFLGATAGPVCKPHGTLHCSIRVPGQAVAGAVHKWRTTSIVSIQRMLGSLMQIKATCGSMRGLPLSLVLQPVTVTPGDTTTTVYCCHVELRAADLLSVQQQALQMAQMRKAVELGDYDHQEYKALLEPPAGDHETAQDHADISDEFHPEHDDDVEQAPAAEPESEPDDLDLELARLQGELDGTRLQAHVTEIVRAVQTTHPTEDPRVAEFIERARKRYKELRS